MSLGQPEYIHTLWLFLPTAWMFFLLTNRKTKRLEQITDPSMIKALSPHVSSHRIRSCLVLWLVGIACLLIALARPQWGEQLEQTRRHGLDIMVVLDTSKSMLAEDAQPNRLQQAQWGIEDLVQQLKGDRVGLVTFAGNAFLHCPLTIDYAAFLMILDDVYCGIIPVGGTAIAQSLRVASSSFSTGTSSDRVIILITDGEDHIGDPTSLLKDLKNEGIYVFTVGVGSRDGELIPISDRDGRRGFLKDRRGNVVKSSLDDTVLKQLALETGGAYVQSAPGDTGIDRIAREGLQDFRRDESDARIKLSRRDRFAWFVSAGMVCFVIEGMVGMGPFRQRRIRA